jgi:hypothetical protein
MGTPRFGTGVQGPTLIEAFHTVLPCKQVHYRLGLLSWAGYRQWYSLIQHRIRQLWRLLELL